MNDINEMNVEEKSGYVYCLSNPIYKGVYKVGLTKNEPMIRMRQLYSTGVPMPFRLEFAKFVPDCRQSESNIHQLLSAKGSRVNPKREFFEVKLNVIRKLFDELDGEYYSQNEKAYLLEPMPPTEYCGFPRFFYYCCPISICNK